uniref:non-specific serine/threonine protein kinase n=1 Tax=Sedum alfredii TaxID=439688 RepID=A0A410N678_9MAGN|nr:LRR receptor-like serine/threonine-protein kinase EFR [Sedum alfredii]
MNSMFSLVHVFIALSLISAASSASSAAEQNMHHDRTALLALKDEFIAGGTPLENTALNSWNRSLHVCQWQGVTCGKRHMRVTAIELVQQQLKGFLSPSIGNLTFLRNLVLTNNSLHGEIPAQIGRLRRLQYLNLRQNFFNGEIPVEMSNCTNLVKLVFTSNNLVGRIPPQFTSLSKLTYFSAARNSLNGEMPNVFRNFSYLTDLVLHVNNFHGQIGDSLHGLSSLRILSLWSNNFHGTITPLYNMSSLETLDISSNQFIGRLEQDLNKCFPKLTSLSLSTNRFSGTITPLYNLSSLEKLDISINKFTGVLKQDMDIAFPKLVFFSIMDNSFIGRIPESLSNMSGLAVIQMNKNNFTGSVPDRLGKLQNLMVLHLAENNLGGDLSFIDSITGCRKLEWLILSENRFGGSLPESIANFSTQLDTLAIDGNYITGNIPEGISDLSGLTSLVFSSNLFTGTIPNSIGKLTKLSILHLYENNLDGEIPSSVGNLENLIELNLLGNSLTGAVPATLGRCTKMEIMDISRNRFSCELPNVFFTSFPNLRGCDMSGNSFTGKFPSMFVKLSNLLFLAASFNNFTGEIPTQIGELLALEALGMAGNYFEGNIPPLLGNLKSLKVLDLSSNRLSGVIPKELADITTLQNLNLSFNRLSGEVPMFKNVSAIITVTGNDGLCGGNQELHLQPCLHRKASKPFSKKVVIFITVSVASCSVLLLLVCIVLKCRIRNPTRAGDDGLADGYRRVTYGELFKATDGFSEPNLIGSGNFGKVYRGTLNRDEELIAVKVLDSTKHGAMRSFKSECKILKRIRHRNLLRIITSCSSLDNKGNEFMALVFDFMSNGNLDNWLHLTDGQPPERGVLNLAKRIEIGIEVGCALDYLHNYGETPIVHCDLKPSNVLLDDDMVAHVGDFGLAKLLPGFTEILSGGESLSAAVKGTVGYIAPEYGMGAEISPKGDIYSYGIVLLELITGKRPTDDMFNNDVSLRSFAERGIQDHNVEEIVDQCLMNEVCDAIATRRNPERMKSELLNILISFIEVGISCSAESSNDRMDIQSAVRRLKKIDEKYDSLLA